MRRIITQLAVAGTAVAVLSTLTATAASAAAAATWPPQPAGAQPAAVSHGLAAPGAAQWVSRYNSTGNGNDDAKSVAVSPGGDLVFVTGSSGAGGNLDMVTAAYRAATGAQVWLARYTASGNRSEFGRSVAVSPDGTTVFVTGDDANSSYYTVAYDAATGAQLWAAQYAGLGGTRAVVVSPSGATVFITGYSGSPFRDIATVAYNAATGAQLWAARYNAPGGRGGDDIPYAMAVSPDGGTVFVTGSSEPPGTAGVYVTLAYNAATGAKLWQKTYKGLSIGAEASHAVAVSPDGSTVYITGNAMGANSNSNCVTIAYNAATGARKWLARYYNGSAGAALVASPDGGTVFVSGSAYGNRGNDYLTIAYSAATGGKLWLARYTGPGNNPDQATAAALSPDGATLYVTGQSWRPGWSYDYATVAYSTATGAKLWAQRYGGTVANGEDDAMSLAVSPDGAQVFVTGNSTGAGTGDDYATVAYSG